LELASYSTGAATNPDTSADSDTGKIEPVFPPLPPTKPVQPALIIPTQLSPLLIVIVATREVREEMSTPKPY
jgi:hypothetical protein